MGELTLKLFGNTTEEDVEYILEVVDALLKNGMGEALAVENGFIDDLNTNTTKSDADKDGHLHSSRASQGMSAGRKIMVSLLVTASVAFIAVFAYRRLNRPEYIPDGDESDENDDDDGVNPPPDAGHGNFYGP